MTLNQINRPRFMFMNTTGGVKAHFRAALLGLGLVSTVVLPITCPTVATAAVQVNDFSQLVTQVTPGVARVNVTKQISESDIARAQTAELLKRFFGDRVLIPDSQTKPAVERAYGTAFFISRDGYLLTNHHVVEGADRITITLNDRTELDAKLVGSDERSDVAVLKVADDIVHPALPIGQSDAVKVGEAVVAIGSPFGFDYSASAGIVSAKSRNVSRDMSVPFIQTDVALNPGNSGGPLFNTKGEVIGINSRIFSGTGGYMGLSFSIPINEAMDIFEQLKTTGEVLRPYLGVFPQDIDRNLAEAYGLDKPQGALLIKVSPDTPASIAGFKEGDIITTFNGVAILESSDLVNQINRSRPNDNFTATVLRAGKTLTLQGTLIDAPMDMTLDEVGRSESKTSLGLRIRALSEQDKDSLDGQGVLVTSVDPTGLAARSGIQAGDIITSLNRQPIATIEAFADALDSLPEEGVVTLSVVRQGIPAIIGLRIE